MSEMQGEWKMQKGEDQLRLKEKLLTAKQLSIKFGVSQIAIWQMVINNTIPHIKVDTIPYFSVSQIREWQRELMADYRIQARM